MFVCEKNRGSVLVVVLLWVSVLTVLVVGGLTNVIITEKMDHIFRDHMQAFYRAEEAISKVDSLLGPKLVTPLHRRYQQVVVTIESVTQLDVNSAQCYYIKSQADVRLARAVVLAEFCVDKLGVYHMVYQIVQ